MVNLGSNILTPLCILDHTKDQRNPKLLLIPEYANIVSYGHLNRILRIRSGDTPRSPGPMPRSTVEVSLN
jgi:hypothetical protein